MQVATNTISISKCRLQLARPLRKGEATAIRGFFGRKFEDEIFMHNHEPDGKPVYQYPRVQYVNSRNDNGEKHATYLDELYVHLCQMEYDEDYGGGFLPSKLRDGSIIFDPASVII